MSWRRVRTGVLLALLGIAICLALANLTLLAIVHPDVKELEDLQVENASLEMKLAVIPALEKKLRRQREFIDAAQSFAERVEADRVEVAEGIPDRLVFTPEENLAEIEWNEADLARDLAIRPIMGPDGGTLAFGRSKAKGRRHVHAGQDVMLVLLKGGATFHAGEKPAFVSPGDVVLIPRGTGHSLDFSAGEGDAEFVIALSPKSSADFERFLDEVQSE